MAVTIEIYTSSSTGLFLKRLKDELKNLGYNVEIIASINDFSDLPQNKFSLRYKMYVSIIFKSIIHIFFRSKANIRIVTTNPFYLPLFVKFLSSRKCKIIYSLWDLYPDALMVSKLIKKNSLPTRILSAITVITLKKVDATVFLGEEIKKYVEYNYFNPNNARIIPIGADSTPFKADIPARLSNYSKIKIIYSGNLGRMHDIGTIIDFLSHKNTDNIELHFYSSGSGLNILKEKISNPNVFFKGRLPNNQWVKTMRSFPVSLITIAKGAENVVMPSKTFSALAAGQAIIAICSHKSDLANLIKDNDCGWVVENYDSNRLQHIINEIVGNPEILYQKRKNAYYAGHSKYDMAVMTKKWVELINELILKEKN